MSRKQLSEADRAKTQARRDRFRQLAGQVAAMDDAARAELAAKMPALVTIEGRPLSPCNTGLIALQNETATIVGGFRQWIKAGRAVKKGEHGLMIWVPSSKKTDPDQVVEAADAGVELEGERTRFIIGTVFDVSQTIEIETPAAV